MTRRPRDYQEDCITAVRDAYKRGLTGVGIEIFTGGGKGYIVARLSELVRGKGGRVLVIVNRDNLVSQLFDSVAKQGLHPQREQGQDKASNMADMVVGSVQTMQGDRLKRWPRGHFRMIIVDEAHFAAADTFHEVLNWFKSDVTTYHCFLSATMERHDKKGLHPACQELVYSMPLTAGIEEGWLVPFVTKELPVPIEITDKDNAKKMFGDKDEEDIFSRNDYLPRLFAAAGAECVGRKALLFWPGCINSIDATKAFLAMGLDARHVEGQGRRKLSDGTYNVSTDESIKETLEWFAQPGPKVLNNADLLSYGYDNPSIDLIGIMRLSRSLPMLKQRIGRGTRTYGADIDRWDDATERREAIAASPKPSFIVLDLMLQMSEAQSTFAHVGQLITEDKEEQEYIRKNRQSGVPIDLEGMRKLVKAKAVDDDKMRTKLAEDAANAAERKKRAVFYDDILRKNVGNNAVTTKQMKFLRKLGYKGDAGITSWQAGRIIDRILQHKRKFDLV